MRIFVRSTFKDLRPERESAQEALRRSELVPWGMELFVSEPSKPLDICLEQVHLSDAVILIIGFMAGSLIPESPELTYTRAGFELAQRLGRPVFTFFKTEGGVPVNKETDADKKKTLDDFKNAVTSAGITPAYFDSPDRLTTEFLLAVPTGTRKAGQVLAASLQLPRNSSRRLNRTLPDCSISSKRFAGEKSNYKGSMRFSLIRQK